MPSINIKPHLICPITNQVMKDPVTTVAGNTYERAAIENWFLKHDTDFVNKTILLHKNLQPNVEIKKEIALLNLCTDDDMLRAIKLCDLATIESFNYPKGYFNYIYEAENYHHGMKNRFIHAAIHSVKILTYMWIEGADLDARNIAGQTPLHLAVSQNESGAVEFLICNGANVNALDSNRFAPLHYIDCGTDFSRSEERLAIAKILLVFKADPNLKNKWGETPLTKALAAKNETLRDLFLQHQVEILSTTVRSLVEKNEQLENTVEKMQEQIQTLMQAQSLPAEKPAASNKLKLGTLY